MCRQNPPAATCVWTIQICSSCLHTSIGCRLPKLMCRSFSTICLNRLFCGWVILSRLRILLDTCFQHQTWKSFFSIDIDCNDFQWVATHCQGEGSLCETSIKSWGWQCTNQPTKLYNKPLSMLHHVHICTMYKCTAYIPVYGWAVQCFAGHRPSIFWTTCAERQV